MAEWQVAETAGRLNADHDTTQEGRITVPGETLLTFSGFVRVLVTRTASAGEGGANKVKKVSPGTDTAWAAGFLRGSVLEMFPDRSNECEPDSRKSMPSRKTPSVPGP